MRYKTKSETTKRGSGETHDKAVTNVHNFILEQNNKIDVYKEWYLRFNAKFCAENNLRADYEHSYDMTIKNGMKTYFIEIDGEKHSKKGQQINDGIAEKYAQSLGIQVIRLDKRECLGDKEDRDVYLMRKLWKYIK